MPKDLWDIASRSEYDFYGLTGNPFPSTAIVSPEGYESGTAFLDSLRRKELEEIIEKYVRPTMHGDTTNLWVHGDVGVGKSALLLHAQDVINKRYGDNFIAIFIYSPQAGMQSILKDLLSNMQRIGFDRFVARLVKTAIRSNPKIVSSKKKIQLGEDIQYYRDLITGGALEQEAILAELKKLMFKKFPYVDLKFLEPLVEYLSEPEDSIERMKKTASTERLPLLIAFIHALNLAGYKAIFLMIDQLEAGWNDWTKLQKDRFSIDVRELVVRTKPLLAVEVTTNVGILEDIETNWPTLLRPLPKVGQDVVMRPLSVEDILKLVEFYLVKARKDPNTAELAPFEDSAVKEIAKICNKNTFRVLQICHGVLRDCAAKKVKSITKEVIDKMDISLILKATHPS